MATSGAESELTRLRTENHSLAEELAQCQADKEFVWSLWKRLQVASPDLTQAIGMVIQRERQRAEEKDSKVLEILNLKDQTIIELQNALSEQTEELDKSIAKNEDLKKGNDQLSNEVEELKEKLKQSQEKFRELEDHSNERLNLAKDLERSLKRREDEIDNLRQDKEDLNKIRDSQKTRINALENDMKEIQEKYEKISQEHHELKQTLRKKEYSLTDYEKDLKHKSEELESVRKELSDLWNTHTQTSEHAAQQAQVIRQLQSLQQDTQKMLKNQEDAYSMETTSLNEMYGEVTNRYHTLKMTEMELRQELRRLQSQLSNKEGHITELKQQLTGSQNQSSTTQASVSTQDKEVQAMAPDAQIEYRIQSLQGVIDRLREKLREKNKNSSNKNDSFVRDRSLSPISSPRDNKLEKSRDHRRTSSLSPRRKSRSQTMTSDEANRKITVIERKLEESKQQLKLKNEELEELRSAHNKRLDRLRALQGDYKLVRKQLKILEEEKHGAPKKKKKLKRSDPKSLQQENSDTVWNELTYFRNQHRTLVVKNMNLGEEVDSLRVQVAQDAATMHELRTCLEQEREELQFMIEQQDRSSTPTPDADAEEDLALAKAKLERVQSKLKQVVTDYQAANKERNSLYEEKRKIKADLNASKIELAKRHTENTNLKQDIYRLQKELRKKKRKGNNRRLIRHYQHLLNRSVQKLSETLDDSKDDWQVVSDSEETEDLSEISEELESTVTEVTEQTLNTSGSLGQNIAEAAKHNVYDVHAVKERQAEAELGHIHRLNKKNDVKKESVGTSPVARYIHPNTRDVALSPISFGRPHVVSVKSSIAQSGNRQLQAYRHRISTLRKEVALLKNSKALIQKREADQRVQLHQLQNDMDSVSQTLQSSKLTIVRLNGEIERLRRSKEDLEAQLSAITPEDSTISNHRTEEEWALLQSKLRIASHEVSKQLAQIKQLKQENQDLSDRVKQLLEKVNHLERDVAQKRHLVDDMKFKLKIAQENAQSDAEVMLEVESKLKNLADTNCRYKSQVEIYKDKVQNLTKIKYEGEEKMAKLADELEKKGRQVQDLQRKSGQLQGTLNELEKTAQSQMHALASESKTAIMAAQSKLTSANKCIQEFHKFLKVFTHTLLTDIHHNRERLQRKSSHKKEKPPTGPDPRALANARQVACKILNLSQSDLEDILSARDGDCDEEMSDAMRDQLRKDKKWGKKWENLLKSQSEFASGLAELIMEKVDEKSEIAMKLSAAS